MQLKGTDKIREKLPDYPGRKFAVLPLVAMVGGIAGYLFMIVLDIIPRIFSDNALLFAIEPFTPIIGSVLISALALWMIWGLWNKKDEMKELHGDLAYQKIIPRGMTGVVLVVSVVFHAFTSLRSLPPNPVNNLTLLWATPVLALWIRILLAGVFGVLALLTIRSAIITFGLDYMIVIYLYFPEESELQEHEIYSVIRHPTYLGGILLGLAGLVFRFSVYSIIAGLLVYMVFRLQIWKEEKELVERFGEGFIEYQKKVPALLVRPSKIRSYLRFLRSH